MTHEGSSPTSGSSSSAGSSLLDHSTGRLICQSRRLAATIATPAAPRFTQRMRREDGSAAMDAADPVVGRSASGARGACRRSDGGIQRDTYAKLSEAQTGQCAPL